MAGHLLCVLLTCSLAVQAAPIPTDKPVNYPSWWFGREVLRRNDNNQATPSWANHDYPAADDYAAANLGQFKNFASQAAAELNAHLPGGAGLDVNNLIAHWATPPDSGVIRDDFSALNLGQLKAVAKLFYDRLIAVGYTAQYPWTSTPTDDDDFAAANLGQLKKVFSFDLTGFGTGTYDRWKLDHFGTINVDPNADADGDGLTNAQEFAEGADPNDNDSDDDGLSDGREIAAGTNSHNRDSDGDGVEDGQDQYPTDPARSADIPVLRFASLDISTPLVGDAEVLAVAINDSNKVTFSYVNGDDATGLVTWENGVETMRASLPKSQVTGSTRKWREPYGVAPAGFLFGGEFRYDDNGRTGGDIYSWDGMQVSYPVTDPVWSDGSILSYAARDSTLWGFNMFSDQWYIGMRRFGDYDPPKFVPSIVASSTSAVGMTEGGVAFWANGGFAFVFHAGDYDTEVLSLNIHQELLARSPLFTDHYQNDNLPSDADHPFLLSGGTKRDLYEVVPERFRKQVSLYPSSGHLTDLGDVIYGARIFEGPENSGSWSDPKTILIDRVHDKLYQLEGERGSNLNANWMGVSVEDSRARLLLPVEIKKLSSDQLVIAGVHVTDANYLPNKTGQGNKPYLLMGSCQSGNFDFKGHLLAKVNVGGSAELRNKILWRLATKNGSTYTPEDGTSTYNTNGDEVTIVLNNPRADDENSYWLVAGYDQDGNGQLSSSEATIVPQYKWTHRVDGQPATGDHGYEVKIIARSTYDQSRQTLTGVASGWNSIGLKQASRTMQAFLTESTPAGATTQQTTIARDEPGLTHSVGVIFQPPGNPGTSINAVFSPNSEMTQAVADSNLFYYKLVDLLRSKYAEVQQRFNGSSNVIETFNWELASGDYIFDPFDLYRADLDLGLALGKTKATTINVEVEVHRALTIESLTITGTVRDLYDFDYDGKPQTPTWVRQAAKVQGGYNTINNGGRVYKSEIQLLNTHCPRLEGNFEWQ